MKKVFFYLLLLSIAILPYAQLSAQRISVSEIRKIESILSADSMMGRKTFTDGSRKAADFISRQFSNMALSTFQGLNDYQQKFTVVHARPLDISATFNGQKIADKQAIAFTCLPALSVTQNSGFKKAQIKAGSNFSKQFLDHIQLKENLIVFVDSSFGNYFGRLGRYKENLVKSAFSVVFVLGNFENATDFSINATHDIKEDEASNVIGVLPGKSKKDEFIIFSAHYDHLGIGKPVEGDSIFNGANDNASGVTAIIALARHFKAANNNERTLIFTAFTAEEIGGFGSQFFSKQISPAQVVAMLNIEMIGTDSKWGKNSAFITGYDKSDLGTILQKNLKGSRFNFYPDPYPDQQLFYRSDNATLARLGVPAHTISTSKMDNEPNYHQLTDEISTLDLSNMTSIIRSILKSSRTLVNGKDTPSRVNTENID